MAGDRRFKTDSPVPYVVGEGKYLSDLKTRTAKRPYGGPKPVAASPFIEAKIEATCWVCKNKMAKGALICKARFPNGKRRWVHAGCCRDGET